MNWHNTLKRLKKDDDFGRSPHSLNHVIVKRKPATLYMAQAMRDIVKDVDKPHKEVPGIKKLVKEAGAKGGSDVIAEGTASSASGTHLQSSGAESRVGSASHISSVRPGDLSVDDLKSPGAAIAQHTAVRSHVKKSGASSRAQDLVSQSHLAASFQTAKSTASSSATKDATRKLFSESVHLPAAQVSAVNNKSRVGRAKGAAADSAVKPLAKRATPARGAGGKWLKREGGGASARTAVVKDALQSPGEKPKRKRAPKSAQKAEALAQPAPSEFVPPAPPKGLNLKRASAGVGPRPRRALPKPPVASPPAPAPPEPAAPEEAPASPKHDYHSFRKANAGKGMTPKRMAEAWKAWKDAHPK